MNVGDLCRWHDSASKKFKTGIIIERRRGPALAQYFTFFVLWNSGKITECSPWQLSRTRNESR